MASILVERGVLTGVVVDERTGAALPRAQVLAGPRSLAVTDSAGYFRVRLGPGGSDTLRIFAFGFVRVRRLVRLHPDTGYVAVLALQRDTTRLCMVRVSEGGPPAVRVTVRAAHTGRPPGQPVTLVVRDGAYRDSVVVQPGPLSMRAAAAQGRQGRYEVTVKVAGFRDWHGHAETTPMEGCPPSDFRTADLQIWLVPE